MVDTCAGEFPAATPYLYSSYEDENEAPPSRPQEDHHPRQRPEPHRAGHRVRLLLRAGRARAARGGLRDDHGQLEPGDRLDRLRHLRQALLRAAHARGRARDRRAREAARRDRAARRTDAAQARASRSRRWACRSWARSVDAIDRAEDRDRFAEVCREIGATVPPNGIATSTEQAVTRSPTTSAIRCWCVPPTCWAAARWRSSTTSHRCSTTSSARCAHHRTIPC